MTQAIATHDEHAVQTGVVLIPLNKLKKSPDNVRKTPHAKAEIEALAASIHAKGILQNLVVAPEFAETGAATGFYFVTIGEGRRQAQLLRVKRKQIAETEPVRCVIDTGNDAREISLDENVTRSAMSAMDEVEAFAGLVDGGMSADDVARRFGCTVRLVEQRLALARLSPKIRAAYRKGDIIATRDIACYIPSKDVIGMPPIGAFDTAEDYAATLNHESVHATLAPHRVGRDMGKKFSEFAIAAEELVAEIGASLLGAHLRLPPHHIHDHASYIGHWMKLLADDKRAFLAAAAQAQIAVDWLLAKSPSPFVEEEIVDVAA